MKKEELKQLSELISQVSLKEQNDLGMYEAYGVLEKMQYSKEDLKATFKVLWEILMTGTEVERKEKYLFDYGFIVAKEEFLTAKKSESDFTDEEQVAFRKAEVSFKRKLENVRPAIEFIIRLEEVL
jgi:hypothetical protein